MAKVVNTWRSGGNAKKIFEEWERLYSRARALQCARTLPPRALRGRWGSKCETERFLLRCRLPELRSVFCNLFDPDPEDDVHDVAGNADGADDDLGVIDPDEATHAKRNRKWSREACRALRAPAFWCKLIIGHICCKPADHMSAWIKKPLESGVPPKIVHFMTTKARRASCAGACCLEL